MSMMVSFVLSFFPRDVLDEILNLIESVSEDFPSYSFMISISLSEKFCCQDLSTRINVINMTGHSSKSNKFRNINTITHLERGTTLSRNGKFTISKSKSSRLS